VTKPLHRTEEAFTKALDHLQVTPREPSRAEMIEAAAVPYVVDLLRELANTYRACGEAKTSDLPFGDKYADERATLLYALAYKIEDRKARSPILARPGTCSRGGQYESA